MAPKMPPIRRLAGARSRAITDAMLRRWTHVIRRDGVQSALGAIERVSPELARYMSDERPFDWRYLLPYIPAGRALCVGGSLSLLPFLLARSCSSVAVLARPAETSFLLSRVVAEGCTPGKVVVVSPAEVDGPEFDLVCAVRRAPGLREPGSALSRLERAVGLVRPGGYICVEVDSPALVRPPARLASRLRARGFGRVSVYWPKLSFSKYEMYIPMCDRRIQRYYLDYLFFATSPARRALRVLLRCAVEMGLFERTLAGHVVLARRNRSTSRC